MERFFKKLPRDRRLARRFDLHIPIRLRALGVEVAEQHLMSDNVSQRGVFFATDMDLSKGATVDLLLQMPEEVTGVTAAQWLCTGHVVRVEKKNLETGEQRLAVQFDFYEASRNEMPGWQMRVGLRGPIAPMVEW
jgi:hypothetical protein